MELKLGADAHSHVSHQGHALLYRLSEIHSSLNGLTKATSRPKRTRADNRAHGNREKRCGWHLSGGRSVLRLAASARGGCNPGRGSLRARRCWYLGSVAVGGYGGSLSQGAGYRGTTANDCLLVAVGGCGRQSITEGRIPRHSCE